MTEPSTDRVAAFIACHALDAEILSTPSGVPTVELAAIALGVEPEQIIKTLVFASPGGALVVGIACGTARVDRRKLAAVTGVAKLTFASAEQVLASTRYPAGGVAPIGLPDDSVVVVDEIVVEQPEVYGGAGTDRHMMRIRTADIVRLNRAVVASIVQQIEP